MTESVYQKAKKAMESRKWSPSSLALTDDGVSFVLAALEAGEKAEARVKELERMLRPDGLQYDLIERAEKAEARVRELEMVFKRMTLIKNVGGEGSTIAVIDFPAIEKVLGPEVLGPVSEPGQSTDVTELDMPRESVTTPAEPGPASVAEQEPASEVSADVPGDAGQH